MLDTQRIRANNGQKKWDVHFFRHLLKRFWQTSSLSNGSIKKEKKEIKKKIFPARLMHLKLPLKKVNFRKRENGIFADGC